MKFHKPTKIVKRLKKKTEIIVYFQLQNLHSQYCIKLSTYSFYYTWKDEDRQMSFLTNNILLFFLSFQYKTDPNLFQTWPV